MNAPMTLTPIAKSVAWHDVCAIHDVLPYSGVCALIGGRQVAIVRTADEVFALGNFDPFSKAMVLARGIVGDAKGTAKITSPVYKQSFGLRDGRCIDDPSVTVPTFPCRVRDGRVEVEA